MAMKPLRTTDSESGDRAAPVQQLSAATAESLSKELRWKSAASSGRQSTDPQCVSHISAPDLANQKVASGQLPLWARRLLARHPDSKPPSAAEPLPPWLANELDQIPLWAFIRGADDVRTGHPYFLIEDVKAQPKLMDGVLHLRTQINEVVVRLLDTGVRRVVFTGCGSAFFTSILAAFLLRHWSGVDAEAIEALEFTNYGFGCNGEGRTALIAQSATGGSIETLLAIQRARDEGLTTIALVNTARSAMGEICDDTIVFETGQKCGPDVSVITTRLMMLYLLAVEMGRQTGRLTAQQVQKIESQIADLPRLAATFLQRQESCMAEIASKLSRQSALLFVGGGPNWFSAREAALKVDEESSMVCKAYRPAEYPHDAIALLSPQVTTVALAPTGKSYQRVADSLRTGQIAGSKGLAFVAENDRLIAAQADWVVRTPGMVDEMFLPPLATIFGQTLGYYLGVERGCNPDTLRTDNLDHARAWLTAFPLGSH